MRSFNDSTILDEKLNYIEHFVNWCYSEHNAYYIRGTLNSQELTDIMSTGNNLLCDFSRIIDEFLAVDRSKKELFCDLGPMGVNATTDDAELQAVFRLFKIYWLSQDIKNTGEITAPLQLLSMNYPMITCHPGSDKRFALFFLCKPIESIPYVYIDYSHCEYKFYESWNYEHCDTVEKIIACFPNFYHESYHSVYEWIEMWQEGCSPHNTPVYNGIKKYNKKVGTWAKNKDKIAVWHLSYYDAKHRIGMTKDLEMLWDINLQDDSTLYIGDHRIIKENGIWRPDNGNFNASYNPISPIDRYTPYNSRWF